MFLSQVRAAADDRSPWGDFWFEPVSVRTMSGMRVSAEGAMQLSAVFRAVQLLSGHFAMLPMLLKQPGNMTPVARHPLLTLFKKPNRWQNGFEWRQMLQGHLLLRGNAFNEIVDNARGEIVELVPRHPDRVTIEMLPGGDYRYRISDPDGTQRPVARGQMWHLRGLSSNGLTGLSVVECARESMGLSLSAQAYGGRFFANDAKPSGGWVEVPGKFADKTAKTNFREAVQEAQSSANRGKMMVLDQGMKFHEVGLSNDDAQFLETRKFQISEIARWFGVPPHKLADLERATFSNIEQQAIEYITDSLLIWAEVWEAAIEDGLLFDTDGLEVEFDFARLTRGDSTARANFAQKAIMAGYLTRNEARAMERLAPLDGLDEPLRPLNMVEEGDAEDEEEDLEAAAPPVPEKKEPTDAAASTRLHVMVQGTARRLARRIVRAGALVDADVGVIADALALDRALVEAWRDSVEGIAMDEDELAASLFALAPVAASNAVASPPPTIIVPAPRIEIHAPITVTPPAISLEMPVNFAANIEANRAVTRTVISERKQDGTIVSRVIENDA